MENHCKDLSTLGEGTTEQNPSIGQERIFNRHSEQETGNSQVSLA